jgi:hypothetical protein
LGLPKGCSASTKRGRGCKQENNVESSVAETGTWTVGTIPVTFSVAEPEPELDENSEPEL